MKKTIAIMTALLATITVSAPVRSLVAARNAAISESEQKQYTAKDYIQDGLIVIWDGLENIGYGSHDETSTVWVDLSGNGNDLTSGVVFEDGAFVGSSAGITIPEVSEATKNKSFTLEICMMFRNPPNNTAVITLNGSTMNNFCLETHDNVNMRWFKWTNNQRAQSLTVSSFIPVLYNVTCNGDKVSLTRNNSASLTMATGNGYASGAIRINFWGNNSAIYSIRMYNRALSDDECAHNYKIDKARFNLQ